MGEIAEMMLDGTMDPETGEWNFDGEDGPGWPMTGAEAAQFKRANRPRLPASRGAYQMRKDLRKKVEAFGKLQQNDAWHWQVRGERNEAGKRPIIADWWPHKGKYRIGDKTCRGNEADFLRALAKARAQ